VLYELYEILLTWVISIIIAVPVLGTQEVSAAGEATAIGCCFEVEAA